MKFSTRKVFSLPLALSLKFLVILILFAFAKISSTSLIVSLCLLEVVAIFGAHEIARDCIF